MLANAGVGIAQNFHEEIGRKGSQARQSIERVDASFGKSCRQQFLNQQGHGGGIGLLEQQPRGGVPRPTVARLQGRDEFGSRRFPQGGVGARFVTIGSEPIKPAPVATACQVQMFLDFRRQTGRVFDHFTVDVDDREAAIGTVGVRGRSEPDIGRGDEFFAFVRAFGDEAHAIGFEHFAMDDVATDIAHERLADVLRAKRIAAIDCRAGGSGEVTGRTSAALDGTDHGSGHTQSRADDSPRLDRTDAKHLGLRTIGGDTDPRSGAREIRVPRGVTIFVHCQLDVVAVRAMELAAPVVEAHAMLGAAGFRPQVEQLGVERKIASVQNDSGCVLDVRPLDRSAHRPGGTVNAVVESPVEAVDQPLHVRAAEPGEHGFADIGLAVAIGILEIVNIGSRADEDAAVVAAKRRGPGELFGEQAGAVVLAVGVGVFEPADRAEMLGPLFGVIDHFGDVQPAVFIPRDGDGAVDERFRGDLFEMKAWMDPERFEGGGGFVRGDAGQFGREIGERLFGRLRSGPRSWREGRQPDPHRAAHNQTRHQSHQSTSIPANHDHCLPRQVGGPDSAVRANANLRQNGSCLAR